MGDEVKPAEERIADVGDDHGVVLERPVKPFKQPLDGDLLPSFRQEWYDRPRVWKVAGDPRRDGGGEQAFEEVV